VQIAKATISKAKRNKPDKKTDDKVDALFFIGNQQACNLANLAMGELVGKVSKKDVEAALNSYMAVDVALFGRMVAANPLLNCDASAQVAHAISTHRVENEYDFYTAVDENPDIDNAGAGMMGTVEFNSATLYRYATVAAHLLFAQLSYNHVALSQAIREFARAFICAMPTGKQNTFAANTMPDAVLITVRSDRPLSLVGAFESPVRADVFESQSPLGGEGYVSRSANIMEEYTKNIYRNFCLAPDKSYVVGQFLSTLGEHMPLEQLLARLGDDVAGLVI